MKSNSKIPYANPVRWGGLAGMVAGVMAILWHRLPLPRPYTRSGPEDVGLPLTISDCLRSISDGATAAWAGNYASADEDFATLQRPVQN